ncbi:MAG: hypothetical protein ACQEV0_08700 [Bacillota bacterium]
MEATKKFRVVYHFGGGVEAVSTVEAGSQKEAVSGLDADDFREFIGDNDTYYQFKMSEVKMVSVSVANDGQ